MCNFKQHSASISIYPGIMSSTGQLIVLLTSTCLMEVIVGFTLSFMNSCQHLRFEIKAICSMGTYPSVQVNTAVTHW